MQPVTFFSLTPERVLDAVERAGERTTGLCYALNSLENRVYEVELEGGRRVVVKFYRPGRWSLATISDEHLLLARLVEAEVPVCPPLRFPDGATLQRTPDGIAFALFPRTGGRAPEDLGGEDLRQLGRLLARIHTVSSRLALPNRPELSPRTYGSEALEVITRDAQMSPGLAARYADAVRRLCAHAERRLAGVETFVIHADCHRGNLLHGRQGWFFLDFDDAARGPAVQDLWLLLPGRPRDCPGEVEALVEGYEQLRGFDRRTLRLVEALRGLRYVRYAAWITARWADPSFPRAFPQFGSESYWQGQLGDLEEQIALLDEDDDAYPVA